MTHFEKFAKSNLFVIDYIQDKIKTNELIKNFEYQVQIPSRVLTRVTNSKKYFLSKVSNFPLINNLKRPTCASKRDMLALALKSRVLTHLSRLEAHFVYLAYEGNF